MPSIEKVEPRILEREWGEEIIVTDTPLYLGKILKMHAGTAGGLQTHRLKTETFYLHSGKAIVTTDFGDGHLTEIEMVPGECCHIPAGAVHKVTAVTDCLFSEWSTPHYNDRVRMESRYGLKEDGGLPTT